MSDFPGAPKQLTPAELADVTKRLRAAMVEFESRGGRKCHCGGLIYPGERYTCTHGGAPLTCDEIGAIRDAWERDRASTERRALVQGDYSARGIPKGHAGQEPGTIAWWEHLEAYADYARRYGTSQSAERLNDRGGFGYLELVDHLKRAPTTWRKREG